MPSAQWDLGEVRGKEGGEGRELCTPYNQPKLSRPIAEYGFHRSYEPFSHEGNYVPISNTRDRNKKLK